MLPVCSLCFSLSLRLYSFSFFFFFNDTATTEIYTLSLHDALPICRAERLDRRAQGGRLVRWRGNNRSIAARSEEHTSELQSLAYLVCRLLLEKKKKTLIRLQIRTDGCILSAHKAA